MLYPDRCAEAAGETGEKLMDDNRCTLLNGGRLSVGCCAPL